MGFSEFLGNARIVTALRGMLAGERVPHAMLFSGPRGVGKFTLARMFAQAANCQRLPRRFLRRVRPLPPHRTARGPAPADRTGPGAARGAARCRHGRARSAADRNASRRLGRRSRTRCGLKDPVARPVLHVGQLRAVQRAAYFKPQGRRRVFILDGAETMRWDIASIFLKILEEPPESATLILLAPNPFQLLPTIRSRCLQFSFTPLADRPRSKKFCALARK